MEISKLIKEIGKHLREGLAELHKVHAHTHQTFHFLVVLMIT